MDDVHGYGEWRTATHAQLCEGDGEGGGCDQPIDVGDRVQTGPDGRQLGECCGLWNNAAYFDPPVTSDVSA